MPIDPSALNPGPSARTLSVCVRQAMGRCPRRVPEELQCYLMLSALGDIWGDPGGRRGQRASQALPAQRESSLTCEGTRTALQVDKNLLNKDTVLLWNADRQLLGSSLPFALCCFALFENTF